MSKIYYFRSFLKFKSAGKNIMLSTGGKFVRPQEITFGNNVFINNSFHISARSLYFGSDIMIGPGLVIECDNHLYNRVGNSMYFHRNDRLIGKVEIENDVWIGASVVILPNVIIGEGCIIGAGSIVTKSVPPYSICVGNPCKPIKGRFRLEDLKEHLKIVKSEKKIENIVSELEKNKISL